MISSCEQNPLISTPLSTTCSQIRASSPLVSNSTKLFLWTLSFDYYWTFSPCNLKHLTADLNRATPHPFLKFLSFLIFSGLLTLPYSNVTPDRTGHTLDNFSSLIFSSCNHISYIFHPLMLKILCLFCMSSFILHSTSKVIIRQEKFKWV